MDSFHGMKLDDVRVKKHAMWRTLFQGTEFIKSKSYTIRENHAVNVIVWID